MKRRDFLGTLAAGVTLASLPVSAITTPDPIIWNAETLATSLESMFTCRAGPAMGMCYFNSKTGLVEKPTPTETQHPYRPNQVIHGYSQPSDGFSVYHYETYSAGVEGGDAKEAEAKLAKHFYDEFSKVPAGYLVWRLKPHFESEDVVEYGKTFLTRSAVEDRLCKVLADGKVFDVEYRADGSPIVPEDVELDFNTESYRFVTRRYQLHKMRARLVLPEAYDVDKFTIPSLAKNEGGHVRRI